MADTARRLTGLTAAAAALAVLTVQPSLSQPSPPPPRPVDFGRAASLGDAAAARPPGTAAAEGEGAQQNRRQDPSPRRIVVPGAGLDARVRPVGVDGQGSVAVPADPSVAGWYRFGPAPGSTEGSAVLVGHVDGDTGALGEFAALYDVRPGDRIEVRRAGARPVGYRVVSRSTVPRRELPPSVFRRTGSPVLTLVTCAPPFVPERGGYQSNLVVTARPLPS
ncbi:class F sortase [Streptomyces cinereospinus]|uniref:Class F sortase n=1 Tax=Streptomyces cinereospinus TaxID=285561 RepID=A0ABV5N7T3_9ACTN